MEFIDGDTLEAKLQELVAQNTTLPLAEAIRIAGDVASALAYAHRHDMVHRDIKPSNVMINRDHHVILTDFGIAKIMSAAHRTSTGTVGTPNYISPEQGLGKIVDARSDIYSLGAMFFQMVTGQLPYQADSAVSVLLKHVNDPVPIASRVNPALPPGVDVIITKAMAKNPDDRHQTADEFIEHLKQLDSSSFIPGAPRAEVSAVSAPTDQSATLFLDNVPVLPRSAALSDAVSLSPYVLSLDRIAAGPADLRAMCDADWARAVDHFVKGYIAEWLRDGVKQLRAAHQHGLADDLELMAAHAEAIVRRVQDADEIARNAGLEEFLESLGAAPPTMQVTPRQLDLPALGVGKDGQPVYLTIANSGRGYLFGSVACQVTWLHASPLRFGCAAGGRCAIKVVPDLSSLPAGRIQSPDCLVIRSIGGEQHLAVQVDILPSALHVDVPLLDFGVVGQGESPLATFTISNKGRGFLIGRVRCRAPWLTASPEQFKVPAGASISIQVNADSQTLSPGNVTHDWAVMVESNGGNAVLGVQMQVLSPQLAVDPEQIDLGVIDLIQPGARKKALLTVRNAGPGVLTGAVTAWPDWLIIEPAAFRCRPEETQSLHISTAQLKTGDYRQSIPVVSNAGVTEVPVSLRVIFSLEPELVRIPEGWFLRGSQEQGESAAPSKVPQQQIYLSEYWIAKHPVTNAQYAAFTHATGRRPPDHWPAGKSPPGQENHPVVNVSLRDANAYCRWLAELTGKSYRLPTEAQWEKAARGAEGWLYPWGNRWDHKRCNTREADQRGTTPVGLYSPAGDSPYGCADMAGNVLEWVSDWYKEDYYARSAATHDPFGPASGVVRVLRGGSWSSDRLTARCAYRTFSNPTTTNSVIGFRCAVFETEP
jgi:formylglycine-generating enzyme required for sulfatase activity